MHGFFLRSSFSQRLSPLLILLIGLGLWMPFVHEAYEVHHASAHWTHEHQGEPHDHAPHFDNPCSDTAHHHDCTACRAGTWSHLLISPAVYLTQTHPVQFALFSSKAPDLEPLSVPFGRAPPRL